MAKVKIVLNRAGVRELLKSPEMQSIIDELATDVASTAGEGFTKEVRQAGTRGYAHIHAETPKAYYHNAKHNTLLKALGGAKK